MRVPIRSLGVNIYVLLPGGRVIRVTNIVPAPASDCSRRNKSPGHQSGLGDSPDVPAITDHHHAAAPDYHSRRINPSPRPSKPDISPDEGGGG